MTSTWSGGTTTQIAIFPADSNYKTRNFDWRMSSATVDAERSIFTRLTGIQRILMIMRGEMVLEHKGHHRILLRPFEKDIFDGGWVTHGVGRATDFNLMLSTNCGGKLEAIEFQAPNDSRKEEILKASDSNKAWETLYCLDGTLLVQFADANTAFSRAKQDPSELDSVEINPVILNPGDFLLIHRHQFRSDMALTITLEGREGSGNYHAIRGTVFCQ